MKEDYKSRERYDDESQSKRSSIDEGPKIPGLQGAHKAEKGSWDCSLVGRMLVQ